MSMNELFSLKEEFLNKFLKDGVEKDAIKSIRKILKEFKEQIYGGDSLQKILSANVQGALSGTQGGTQSIGSSSTQKGYHKSGTSTAQSNNIQNIQADQEAASQQHNAQQRFLLVAACEEIQKLLKYIVQPYIVIKSCITNFEGSGKKELNDLVIIIKQEFANIDKRIVHVLKNYAEVLPINILDTLEGLQQYYVQQQEEYLSKKLNDIEKLKQLRYLQIQAPYIGYHLVDETRVATLFEKASIQIENLRIQRVGTEFVHHFQKYLTTYVFNKMLMDTDILSGLVVCIKDNKKKKTYFFIQYCDLKVEDIESTSSVDSQIVVTLNKYGQKTHDQPTPTRLFQEIDSLIQN